MNHRKRACWPSGLILGSRLDVNKGGHGPRRGLRLKVFVKFGLLNCLTWFCWVIRLMGVCHLSSWAEGHHGSVQFSYGNIYDISKARVPSDTNSAKWCAPNLYWDLCKRVLHSKLTGKPGSPHCDNETTPWFDVTPCKLPWPN